MQGLAQKHELPPQSKMYRLALEYDTIPSKLKMQLTGDRNQFVSSDLLSPTVKVEQSLQRV